ncbi:5-hydroxytryptamine receptor 2A-like [Lineus longissimus]|uniref:5-hydroxytryptamine receptor 2A-like n=1 Tax=Lineus longissimus TaxID=88925 RepID=UPI002B4EC45F
MLTHNNKSSSCLCESPSRRPGFTGVLRSVIWTGLPNLAYCDWAPMVLTTRRTPDSTPDYPSTKANVYNLLRVNRTTALHRTTSYTGPQDSDIVHDQVKLPQQFYGLQSNVSCEGILCFGIYTNNSTGLNASLQDQGLSYSGKNWVMLLLGVFVICGILGNLLVCLAICTEKKLQNVTNYFLMSLAIADMMVSIIVMPMSIVNEINGYWPLGPVMCNIWSLSDVLLCTSSILHMSTISLDRYIGIRSPLKTRNKSMRIVGVKIFLVWLLAFSISSPLFVLGIVNEANILNDGICALANPHFIIYGSISAFFIPLMIMVVTYVLTVKLLHEKAMQCKNSGKEGKPMIRRSMSRRSKQGLTPLVQGLTPPRVQNTNPFRKINKSRENGVIPPLRRLHNHDRDAGLPSEMEPLTKEINTNNGGSAVAMGVANAAAVTMPGSHGLHSRHASTSSEQSTLSMNSTAVPRLKGLVQKHSMKIKAATMMLQRRDAIERRERENAVKTEQKAAKVLGIMFGLFVICWAPFFIVNITMPLCSSCVFNGQLLTAFLWFGYISSTINPIIYTVFNRNFRLAFIGLLLCKPWRTNKIYKATFNGLYNQPSPGINAHTENSSNQSQREVDVTHTDTSYRETAC